MCVSSAFCCRLEMWQSEAEDRLARKLDYVVKGFSPFFNIQSVHETTRTFLSPRSKLCDHTQGKEKGGFDLKRSV